jgi:hypothetical protein
MAFFVTVTLRDGGLEIVLANKVLTFCDTRQEAEAAGWELAREMLTREDEGLVLMDADLARMVKIGVVPRAEREGARG